MEENDSPQRRREHEDQRIVRLYATEAVVRALEQIHGEATGLFQRVLSRMTATEQHAVLLGLNAPVTVLGSLDKEHTTEEG